MCILFDTLQDEHYGGVVSVTVENFSRQSTTVLLARFLEADLYERTLIFLHKVDVLNSSCLACFELHTKSV